MERLVRFSPQIVPLFDAGQLSDDHRADFLAETFLNNSIYGLGHKIPQDMLALLEQLPHSTSPEDPLFIIDGL